MSKSPPPTILIAVSNPRHYRSVQGKFDPAQVIHAQYIFAHGGAGYVEVERTPETIAIIEDDPQLRDLAAWDNTKEQEVSY